MNDFTKRELEIIRNLINNLDEKMLTWSEEVILVQSKIQWMIDNYCEHEWENYYMGNMIRGIYCAKCNRHLKGS